MTVSSVVSKCMKGYQRKIDYRSTQKDWLEDEKGSFVGGNWDILKCDKKVYTESGRSHWKVCLCNFFVPIFLHKIILRSVSTLDKIHPLSQI